MDIFATGHSPKFCFVCAAPLRMAYPGSDPENGPAEPRCTKDDNHPNVYDAITMARWNDTPRRLLGDLGQILRDMNIMPEGVDPELVKRIDGFRQQIIDLEQELLPAIEEHDRQTLYQEYRVSLPIGI